MLPIISQVILKNAIGCIMLLSILFIDKNVNFNKKTIITVFIVYVIKNILSITSLYHVSLSFLITIISNILHIGVIIICSNNKVEGYVSYTKYTIISSLFSFIFSFFGSFSFTFPFARYKWFYYLSYLVIILVYYIINRVTTKEVNKLNIIINTILIVISFIGSYAFRLYYIGYLESFIIKIGLLIIMIVVNNKKIDRFLLK